METLHSLSPELEDKAAGSCWFYKSDSGKCRTVRIKTGTSQMICHPNQSWSLSKHVHPRLWGL